MGNAPLPGQVNFNRLSPASKEILGQVALRLVAGWTALEVADEFNRVDPAFKHVPPPKTPRRGSRADG